MNTTAVTTSIPCLDLQKQHRAIRSEILAAMSMVYDQSAFSDGPFVKEFEDRFAKYCNTNYAVGVNNGTSALHLALLTLGIGRGDEVIVPSNTFIATAWAVSYTGAVPIFADCTSDTWQIDPKSITAHLSRRTKAVIGVHLYGQPCNVDAIQAICKDNNLFFIEDAAQAHGARFKGKRVGQFGEMACFSFYPGKNLGACGEAGAVVTNSERYQQRLRSLRNHGSSTRYYHDELGFNMRMSGMEAASLKVKLQYLDGWNERRKTIASRYHEEIHNPNIVMQAVPDWADPVYHLFVITVSDRNALTAYLNAHDIFPGLHYPVPCHKQKAYAHLGGETGDCPQAEYLSAHCLSLPMYAELQDEQVSRIIEVLNLY